MSFRSTRDLDCGSNDRSFCSCEIGAYSGGLIAHIHPFHALQFVHMSHAGGPGQGRTQDFISGKQGDNFGKGLPPPPVRQEKEYKEKEGPFHTFK